MRRMPLWMLWTQSRSKQGKGGQKIAKRFKSDLRAKAAKATKRGPARRGTSDASASSTYSSSRSSVPSSSSSSARGSEVDSENASDGESRGRGRARGLGRSRPQPPRSNSQSPSLPSPEAPSPTSPANEPRSRSKSKNPSPISPAHKAEDNNSDSDLVGCPSSIPKSFHSLAKSAQPGSPPFASDSATSPFVP